MQIQIVVITIFCQFLHTSATVAINKRVNCIITSIRFLVVELLILIIDDGDLTWRFRRSYILLYTI